MNSKLTNITTQYRKFSDNQVLTEGQLNEFLDYFEDQDRLSRTRLSGVGIVCGFKSNIVTDSDGYSLHVTQGAGITTDGDLITLSSKITDKTTRNINIKNKVYTHYKTYDLDNLSGVEYLHFRESEQHHTFYELVSKEDIKEGDTSYTRLGSNKMSLSTRVLVLFLEPNGDLYNDCKGADCDNNGIKQAPILRMLAIDTAAANKIGKHDAKDSLFNKNETIESQFAQLVNIEVPRVLITTHITSDSMLKTQFSNVINSYSIIANLANGINIMAEYVGVSLGTKEVITSKLNAALVATGKDYQYRYDLLKDLVATYKELKALVLRLKSECCPDITSFPKHLMLGKVGDALKLGERIQHRHPFIKSPIIPEDSENKKQAELLLNRFNKLMSGYIAVPGDDTKEIKITPSHKAGALGRKAIPYYYKVESELLGYWDFVKTKETKQKYNLSYHRSVLAQDGHIQNPLSYNIESNDFYRIEGHLGQDYDAAYRKIEEIKSKHGLSFDVKAVYLKTEAASTSTTVANVLKVRQPSAPVTKEHLSEFLEMHAGLNHLAGVQPGGTFVLVYESEANKQVIADFTLPYLCCQKGTAVAISVSSTTLCGSADPMPINVQPMNAEVKVYANGVEVPAIIKQNGQTLIDPKKVVAAGHAGKNLELKVNGKAVPTTIKVGAIPTVSVTPLPTATIIGGKRVSFDVTGDFTNIKAIEADLYIQSADPLTKKLITLTAEEQKVNGKKTITYDYMLPNATLTYNVSRKINLISKDNCKTDGPILKSLSLTPGKDTITKILVHYPSFWKHSEGTRELAIFGNIRTAINNVFSEYNDNIEFVPSLGDHRILNSVNMKGATPDGKVLNLVFGGSLLYRGYNSTTVDPTLKSDYDILKARLENNFGKGSDATYFKAAIFPVYASILIHSGQTSGSVQTNTQGIGGTQLNRSVQSSKLGSYTRDNKNFIDAMKAIENGNQPYANQSLKNYVVNNKIAFGYNIGYEMKTNYYGDFASSSVDHIENIIKATVKPLGYDL